MDKVKTMVWELGVFSVSGITLFRNYDNKEEDSKEIFDLGNQKYTEVIGNIYENKELLEVE